MLTVSIVALTLAPRAVTAQVAPAAPPATAAAPPMSAEARQHYDRGIALYTAKDFTAAIAELEAGYALDPRREFLFAEAQAHRLDGDCHRAVPLYQRFLATAPTPAQVSAAQMGLARCAQQMAAAPPAVLPPPPAPAPPAAPAPPPPASHWTSDRLAGALLAGGVLALGTGGAFLLAAARAPDGGATYDDYSARRATVEHRFKIGLPLAITGAALTGAAIVRYHFVRRATAAPVRATVGAALTPAAAALVLEGRF